MVVVTSMNGTHVHSRQVPAGVNPAGNEPAVTAGSGPAGVYNSQIPVTTVTGSGSSQNSAALGSQASNNDASKKSKDTGDALKAAGMAMMAMCMPPPMNCSCCPIAAMLLAMGSQADDQSDANKGAAGQHGMNAGLNQDYTDTSAPAVSKVSNFGQQLAKDVKKYGMTYDPSTGKFTLQNGLSFSKSDLSNPAAMASAGVNAEDYAKAMKMGKDAAAAAEKARLNAGGFGIAEGGGVAGAKSRSPASEEEGAGLGTLKGNQEVAGMITIPRGQGGSAEDDIFLMMSRRYREKDNKDSFLPPESAPDASM